jgi:hypothetical protein
LDSIFTPRSFAGCWAGESAEGEADAEGELEAKWHKSSLAQAIVVPEQVPEE